MTAAAIKLVVGGKTVLDPRSAAHLVRWTAGLRARITARRVNRTGERIGEETAFVCDPPSPGALLRLIGLGVQPGERVVISAEGPDAGEAIRRAKGVLSRDPPMPGAQEAFRVWWDAKMREGMPPVDAELERALCWWVAATTVANPSEEMQAEMRELAEDHVRHAIYHERLWAGEERNA